MVASESVAVRAVELTNGVAEVMGRGAWVLCRTEETPRGSREHTFGLGEGDRVALLSANDALTVTLEDGVADSMGCGIFVLSRIERDGRRQVPHWLTVTVEDLEKLAA